MAGRYRALLIGNSTYPADEHNLQALKGPVKDIAALNRALADPGASASHASRAPAMAAAAAWNSCAVTGSPTTWAPGSDSSCMARHARSAVIAQACAARRQAGPDGGRYWSLSAGVNTS